ncbi:SDR family oxidoreductase [Microbacterium thalassium]|uniref:NADP-dependent 3-hydroxy acid dehydrogenase YdfG n=1 Tax=Microbacterium thalassium TaxID=362649 RepID=A0A7X0FM34_9MICO|nr:SDR family oxidoreductase [Microbacterium thalassium]MBB6390013.1 NADP-dependent 3-hydroxy acid dehydrogenase YdfG [Microbacterium thalassium]GLK24736.1 short chain dehydrogenase [Microbacterium thalassium]
MTDPRPVALVTGATGGMGEEIVRDLARTHDVIAVGRRASSLEALGRIDGVTTWTLELTDTAAFAPLVETLHRLDVLVHGAAIADPGRVDEASAEQWTTQLTTNVVAPAVLTGLVLPLLRASAGTVVFIGSGAGTRPVPGNVVYSASKHALRAVADVLRIDEEASRIRVVTVAPGQTDTAMQRQLVDYAGGEYERERYITPASVAEVVRFVVDAPADVQLTDIAVRPRVEIRRL